MSAWPKRYPKNIQIKRKRVSVRVRKKLDDKKTLGFYQRGVGIRIKRAKADDMAEVFVHELLHAIEDSYGIKISHKTIYELAWPLALTIREVFGFKIRGRK